MLEAQYSNDYVSPQQQQILTILKKLLEKILSNQFVVANIFVAKQENIDILKKMQDKLLNIETNLSNKKCMLLNNAKEIDGLINKLISLKLDGKVLERNNALLDEQVESITYCLQPFVAVNVLLHPNCSSQKYASHLKMIQHLKKYPLSRIYSELIRSALISLQNVSTESEVSREPMWFAFTFIRVPHIIKQMSIMNGNCEMKHF